MNPQNPTPETSSPATQPPPTVNKEQKSGFQTFLEVVGTFGGVIALVIAAPTALLLLLGRNYTSSFFTTLKVPSSLITLSAWEYYQGGLPYLLSGVIAAVAVVVYGFALRWFYLYGLLILLPANILVDALWAVVTWLFKKLIPSFLFNTVQKIFHRVWKTFEKRRVFLRGIVRQWWNSRKSIYLQRYSKITDDFMEAAERTRRGYVVICFVFIGTIVAASWVVATMAQATKGGEADARQVLRGKVLHAEIAVIKPLGLSSTNVLSTTMGRELRLIGGVSPCGTPCSWGGTRIHIYMRHVRAADADINQRVLAPSGASPVPTPDSGGPWARRDRPSGADQPPIEDEAVAHGGGR